MYVNIRVCETGGGRVGCDSDTVWSVIMPATVYKKIQSETGA